jgi:hypothetical protein
MDPYVLLAKTSIEQYLKTGRMIGVPDAVPSAMLSGKAGVFVSLHTVKNHQLRGCIGTFEPTQSNVAEEIIRMAVCAATEDPRFTPVRLAELNSLEIHVDVLSAPEKITDTKLLDPKKYGLIIANQHARRGLLLPDIGVKTVEEQIDICCDKGGMNRNQDQLAFYRFTVERHA